jgi:hypothetical protein
MAKKTLKITIFSFFEKHFPTSENFTFAHIGMDPLHKELGESKKGHCRKGSIRNLAFLLVKSFKLASRHLDEGPRP